MEETLTEKKVTELRRGLECVLTRRSAALCNAVTNCLDSFAGEMFSHSYITRDVKEHPTFDKILHEFTAILGYKKTLKEVEDSCKVLIDALQRCGGPLQVAARDLTEAWSTYARQDFKIDFIIKAPQQERTYQSFENHKHQQVIHSSSHGQLPSYLLRQPIPSSSAMLGRHMRRHPSIQKAIVDQFNPHTHQPLTSTWDKHYSDMPVYEVPILANEQTKGGAWEVPSKPLNSSELLTEETTCKYSISDFSVRYSDSSDFSPPENHVVPSFHTSVSSKRKINSKASSENYQTSYNNDVVVPETDDQINLEFSPRPLVPTGYQQQLEEERGRLPQEEEHQDTGTDQLLHEYALRLQSKDEEIMKLEEHRKTSESMIYRLQSHMNSLEKDQLRLRKKYAQDTEELKKKLKNKEKESKNALIHSHKNELAEMKKEFEDKNRKMEKKFEDKKKEIAKLQTTHKEKMAAQKKELRATAEREMAAMQSKLQKEKRNEVRKLEGKLRDKNKNLNALASRHEQQRQTLQEKHNNMCALMEISRTKERKIFLTILMCLLITIAVILYYGND